VRFDKVPSIHWREEFDAIVSTEQPFIAVETDTEFSSNIAEKL
jgi:hypothetical protein